jgi:hypothetical protein
MSKNAISELSWHPFGGLHRTALCGFRQSEQKDWTDRGCWPKKMIFIVFNARYNQEARQAIWSATGTWLQSRNQGMDDRGPLNKSHFSDRHCRALATAQWHRFAWYFAQRRRASALSIA